MFPVVVIAAASFAPYPDDPPVCLDDAYRFNIQPEVAHLGYCLACQHQRDSQIRWTVYEYNPLEVAEQWEADVAWRRQCWSDLEDVLFYSHANQGEDGLRKMRRLRDALGAKDYYAGRFPTPTPNYDVRAK